MAIDGVFSPRRSRGDVHMNATRATVDRGCTKQVNKTASVTAKAKQIVLWAHESAAVYVYSVLLVVRSFLRWPVLAGYGRGTSLGGWNRKREGGGSCLRRREERALQQEQGKGLLDRPLQAVDRFATGSTSVRTREPKHRCSSSSQNKTKIYC